MNEPATDTSTVLGVIFSSRNNRHDSGIYEQLHSTKNRVGDITSDELKCFFGILLLSDHVHADMCTGRILQIGSPTYIMT
jgi:hypothetical protein